MRRVRGKDHVKVDKEELVLHLMRPKSGKRFFFIGQTERVPSFIPRMPNKTSQQDMPPSRNKARPSNHACQECWQHKNPPSDPPTSSARAWKMEDPNLIATLIPVDEDHHAENVFSHLRNKRRCLRPKGIDDEPVISSREPTPARSLSPKDNTKGNPGGKHHILLNFDPPPKDLAKGFAFGTDQERCDVLLASRGVRQTSGVHFHIKFKVIRGTRRLVLTDSSTNGSAVSYSGQAEDEVRRHFTWILDLEKRDGDGRIESKWEVKVHVRWLAFKVELASHETCAAAYDENVNKFLQFSRTDDTPLGGSGNDSHLMEATRGLNVASNLTDVAPSQSESPGKRRVYISEGNIGKGSFGMVDRVIDVSTGVIYARKTFFGPAKHARERWLDSIRREIRIMREHPHVSAIRSERTRRRLTAAEGTHS